MTLPENEQVRKWSREKKNVFKVKEKSGKRN